MKSRDGKPDWGCQSLMPIQMDRLGPCQSMIVIKGLNMTDAVYSPNV